MAKNSFRPAPGGKQGFGGRMPPQTNMQPLARMAQAAAQQRQANPTAQQFAPQAPVTTMPVNPNMPVQKGPQFRVPPSGGKGGLGGRPMPQQPSPQNSGRNMALAQAMGRFRR